MISLNKGLAAKVMGLPLAAVFALAATPAAADGNLVASYPLLDEETSPTVIGDGDAQYRQLFAEWKALDEPGPAPRSAQGIAVPSGMPLLDARLTSNFGMRTHPVMGGRRSHKGIDLAASTGTPIYATADGRVSMSQYYGSYGNYVQLEHGAELQTRYAHMSSMTVREGEQVRKGQLIGYVGSTGRSTGPHLHYEVRMAGEAVDPLPYMAHSPAQQAFAMNLEDGGQGGPE